MIGTLLNLFCRRIPHLSLHWSPSIPQVLVAIPLNMTWAFASLYFHSCRVVYIKRHTLIVQHHRLLSYPFKCHSRFSWNFFQLTASKMNPHLLLLSQYLIYIAIIALISHCFNSLFTYHFWLIFNSIRANSFYFILFKCAFFVPAWHIIELTRRPCSNLKIEQERKTYKCRKL